MYSIFLYNTTICAIKIGQHNGHITQQEMKTKRSEKMNCQFKVITTTDQTLQKNDREEGKDSIL